MKTFLNVLYRRILYKIPLKLLLVLLAIFGLLFACTKADFTCHPIFVGEAIYQQSNNYTLPFYRQYFPDANSICLVNDSQGATLQYRFNSSDEWSELGYNEAKCFDNFKPNSVYLQCKEGTKLIDAGYIYYDNNCLGQHYSSLQCQTEYNLIPIEDVDQNYCTNNNLCPSSNCPNVGVSNLFINDIFHPGAFNIIMNIPEEISRDYAYTNSGNNFNLDIEGYNVDYEKMQSVIDNQSYIPTEEDFQNIIAILTPYTKIIVFFVFLFIIWAWIKKPFKSKKL